MSGSTKTKKKPKAPAKQKAKEKGKEEKTFQGIHHSCFLVAQGRAVSVGNGKYNQDRQEVARPEADVQ